MSPIKQIESFGCNIINQVLSQFFRNYLETLLVPVILKLLNSFKLCKLKKMLYYGLILTVIYYIYNLICKCFFKKIKKHSKKSSCSSKSSKIISSSCSYRSSKHNYSSSSSKKKCSH